MVSISERDVQNAIKTAIDRSVITKEGKEPKKRKFVESVDLIVNVMDVNLNDPKSRISAEVMLPNDVSNDVSALIVSDGDRKIEAEKLGYDTLDKEGLERIPQMDKKNVKKVVKSHEYFIAQADLMRFVAQYLGRYLGPRGRMPIPPPNGFGIFQPSDNVKEIVDKYKSIVRVSMKKQPLIQLKVGNKEMPLNALTANIMTILNYLDNKLPRGLDNVKSVFVKTTMGPSTKVVTGAKKKGRKR